MELFANNPSTTITAGGTSAPAGGTTESWTAASSAGFPAVTTAAGTVFHVADPAAPSEVIAVTNVSGATWSVTRGAESSTPVAHTGGFTVKQVVTAGVLATFPQSLPADYVIFKQGSVIYAVNTATGVAGYAGADGGAALQTAITALGSTGGTVWFKAGTYAWSSVPSIPRSLPTWLRIIAEPGTTVSLSSSGSRFVDFNKIASGDTFRYVWLEGITLDCTGIAAVTGGRHLLIGTWAGSGGVASGTNVNLDHITVRNCRVLNGFTGASATARQLAVWLEVYQDASGLALNTVTNIVIDGLEVTGCNYAAMVGGAKNGSWTGEVNITGDNIIIRNVKHDVGSDSTGFDTWAHIQVGDAAIISTLWIDNVWGRGSRDVGIEVDNALDCHIRNCYFLNCNGYAINITNFRSPADLNSQCYDVSDVTLVRNGGVWDSNAASAVAVTASNNNVGVQVQFGRLRARNIRVYVSAASLNDIVTDGVTGELMTIKANCAEVTLADSDYYATGYQQTSLTTQSFPSVIYVTGGTTPAQTKLTLRNLDLYLNVVNVGSALKAQPTIIQLNGVLDINLDDISVNIATTSPGSFNSTGIRLGSLSTTKIDGAIRRFKLTGATDTGTNPIEVAAAANLTINRGIAITDSDFSVQAGTRDIDTNDTTNRGKLYVSGNRYVTDPKAAYTVTLPASNTATQFTGLYPGTLVVTGGTTVTAVSVSKDNATYTSVPVGSATPWAAVAVSNGDYFKVTYTGTPVLTLVPRN